MNQDISAPRKLVVVLLEDEPLVRFAAAEALREAGFDVFETEHADDALHILHSHADDLHAMFTDVHVPGSMDGLALAHVIRRCWPWIAILISSGRARPQFHEIPLGSRFLPKPYDPEHAVQHIRELVGT